MLLVQIILYIVVSFYRHMKPNFLNFSLNKTQDIRFKTITFELREETLVNYNCREKIKVFVKRKAGRKVRAIELEETWGCGRSGRRAF